MDNTDVTRKVVLVQRSYNHVTGERTIRVKPKPIKTRRTVIARGYRSIGGDRGHTVGDVLTAKVLPFRFAMCTLLRRQGYDVSRMKFNALLIRFYNEFSGLKPIPAEDFVNNVSFKLRVNDNPAGDVNDARNTTAFMEVTEVVGAVINTFKRSRDKYKACIETGCDPEQLLKESELTMARAAFKVERSLMEESKKDHFVDSSELKKTVYWLVGTFVVLWLLSKW